MDNQAIFNQRDPRWNRVALGSSFYLINDWGCTVTSMSRVTFNLTGTIFKPDQLAKIFQFNGEGKLIWASTQKVGVKATRLYSKPTLSRLKEFTKKMLLELNYAPRHWVALEEVIDSNTVKVMDPLKGDFVTKKISEICGYATLELIQKVIPQKTPFDIEVEESTALLKSLGISNGERPDDLISRKEVFVITARSIKKKLP